MNTHVFIVNGQTFKYHLEYMFAGTGASEKNHHFWIILLFNITQLQSAT